MIIDHTEVVEALLARHLIPQDDQHNMTELPAAENVVWYEFVSAGVVEIYTSNAKPWLTHAAKTHDDVVELMQPIGKTPIMIGDDLPELDREIRMWIPMQTNGEAICLLELHKQAYICYQGAIWWGWSSADLMTDPVYVWLVDQESRALRSVM